MSVSLPAVFGRYVLMRRLSRGGMGEIFLGKLGEIEGFEKPIVIKKILPALSRDEEFVERFIEEAKIAINLSHANIVPVYEVGKVDQQFFLAMQYVEGRDLRSLLKRAGERQRPIPPELALLMIREVASGLAYAHRRKDEQGKSLDLVHCDISPPNLLVSFEGEVKIIDFGIARSALHRARDEETIGFGKFGYMAPEQLVRGGRIDRRTDVYAAGVVLYELLTGQRLYRFPKDVDFRRVASTVTAGRVSVPSARAPHLGTLFDSIVMRAIRVNPAERFQSAEALRDEVQQLLYSMDPTISADALSDFVRELCGDERDRDRQILQAVTRTDVAAYRNAVQGGVGHTVSFALGGAYASPAGIANQLEPSQPSWGLLADTGSERRALGATGPRQPGSQDAYDGSAKTGSFSVRPESGGLRRDPTRQMGDFTRQAAASLDADDEQRLASPSLYSSKSRRVSTRSLAIGAVLLTVIIGVVTALALSGGGEQSSALDAKSSADARVVNLVRAVLSDGGIQPDSIVFAPDPVTRRQKKKRPRRGRPSKRSRRKTRPRVHAKPSSKRPPSKKPKSISSADVQRRFRRVASEYRRFERAFGGRLKGQWQKILFAHTYRRVSPRELDKMLQSLKNKMAKIRAGN
jgi:serine/threonine protein kinase